MARMNGPHLDMILARHPPAPAVFVESGTFHGKTTRLAVPRFREVTTIELDPALYGQAVLDLAPLGVTCYRGNSAQWMPVLARDYAEPVCFFLDAHWFKRDYAVAGEAEGLPLWDELTAIAARPYPDIVIVDDVKSFGQTEPTPEWADVSLVRVAGYFPEAREALVWRDQAVVYR